MKRLTHIVLSVLLVAVLAISAFGIASAQDDMMTHTCDSTLITLLFIAEYDYGFESMMDVSTFDKGQYEPLFESMMMDEEMMDDDEMMDDEEMMEDDEMMGDDEMMDDMMMLPIGNIEGEDEACAELRAELDAFFYDTYTSMMMDDEMMGE